MAKTRQKKMAIINDLSGYGRCSLTVQLPLVSAKGIQACPLPTGIFSNHTGYSSFTKRDLSSDMPAYIEEWNKLGLQFDGICIGYLVSPIQVEAVKRLLFDFKNETCKVILDPVMGDGGNLYTGYSKETAMALKELVPLSDLITPNLTELSFLTDRPFKKDISNKELEDMCKELASKGPTRIVVTGIEKNDYLENFCYLNGQCKIVQEKNAGANRPGTGDIFSGLLAADYVNNSDFFASVHASSFFVSKCIKKAEELNIEALDGVPFEAFINLK